MGHFNHVSTEPTVDSIPPTNVSESLKDDILLSEGPPIEIPTSGASPSQIGIIVLTKTKETVEFYMGKAKSKIVSTVRVYGNVTKRQVTKDAEKRADLAVHKIINEPTATIVFFDGLINNEGILVFDPGGMNVLLTPFLAQRTKRKSFSIYLIVLVPIANRTELMEAVIAIDVLRRSGANVTITSVNKQLHGIKIVADALVLDCEDSVFDLITLLGGILNATAL